MKKTRVIFVCTNNSARSQMAEGILRHLYGDRYEVYSAGTVPTSVKPLAIEVMHEIGIDISHHRSKGFGELTGIDFDVAVNVCDQAKKTCTEVKAWIKNRFKDPNTLITIPMKL